LILGFALVCVPVGRAGGTAALCGSPPLAPIEDPDGLRAAFEPMSL
jgi:hypothetical protein